MGSESGWVKRLGAEEGRRKRGSWEGKVGEGVVERVTGKKQGSKMEWSQGWKSCGKNIGC